MFLFAQRSEVTGPSFFRKIHWPWHWIIHLRSFCPAHLKGFDPWPVPPWNFCHLLCPHLSRSKEMLPRTSLPLNFLILMINTSSEMFYTAPFFSPNVLFHPLSICIYTSSCASLILFHIFDQRLPCTFQLFLTSRGSILHQKLGDEIIIRDIPWTMERSSG